MTTKKRSRSVGRSKRRKAVSLPPMMDSGAGSRTCKGCHHLPFGVNVFVALLSLIAVTLSMFVLTSLSVIDRQGEMISALQAAVGSVAQR